MEAKDVEKKGRVGENEKKDSIPVRVEEERGKGEREGERKGGKGHKCTDEKRKIKQEFTRKKIHEVPADNSG